MKLDNWQTKAEKAAERRVRSKQLKNQKQQTRHHKALAQQFVAFLQEHNDAIIRSSPEITIDIWTDTKKTQLSYCDDTPAGLDDGSQHGPSEANTRNDKMKGRPRSNSHSVAHQESPQTPSRQKGRPRSNSDAITYTSSPSNTKSYGSGKKKGRPRSASNASDTTTCSTPWNDTSGSTDTTKIAPPLCLGYFFGSCSATLVADGGMYSRRKHGPVPKKYHHAPQCANGWHWLSSANENNGTYTNGSPTKTKATPNTLASILIGKGQNNSNGKTSQDRLQANQTSLKASFESAALHFGTTDDGMATLHSQPCGMDMLCHHSLSVACHDEKERLADALSVALSQNDFPIGSIAYVVMQGMLVFDRYRDGVVLTKNEQELLLFGGSKRRSVSIGENGECRGRSGSLQQESERSTNSSRTEVNNVDPEDIMVTDNHNMHQRLVQYLPGQLLEFVLSFLPVSATALLPQVCKAWNHEIGRSSPDLWRHLLERYQWPCVVVDDGTTTPSASSVEETTTAYRDNFVSLYEAKRDLLAVKLGLEQLLGRASTNPCASLSSASSKDVAAFDFIDTIGPPISGQTLMQMWSDTRVLVGSSRDCTLHLYDVIDSSNGTGKRCKQSVRVKVVPFASTRKRPYELTAMQLDNSTIGCMFASIEEEIPDVWLVVVQREELLCAGKGGNHISQLGDGVLETFNLQGKVLESIAASGDDEIVAWLIGHDLRHGGVLDTEELSATIASNRLVACGDGNFLFEAYLSLSPSVYDYGERMQSGTLGKIFLFSSSLGKILWISPQNCDPLGNTLVGLGQRIPAGDMHACFTSSLSEAVSIVVNGSGRVECSGIPIPPPARSPNGMCVAITSSEILLVEQYVEEIQDGDQSTRRMKGILHLLGRKDGTACSVDGDLFEGGLLAPILSLRNEFLIALCASNAVIDNYQEQVQIIARLFHIPSRQVIHEATIEASLTAQCLPLSFACDGGPLAVSARDTGMFVAGHGVAYTRNDTWGNKKTKKKKWNRGKTKKDGYARGMRQSMG